MPQNDEAPGRAGGFERRAERRTGHWAVMVPFMSGWTSQMNV